MVEKLNSILKTLKVIAPKDLGNSTLNLLIEDILSEYDLEINTIDFDYNRIYKKGYKDAEIWEDYYVTSYDIVSSYIKTIDDIDFYEFTIE